MFLNALAIWKIAVRKGCVAERTVTIKHRHYVRVTGPDGVDMQGTRRRARPPEGEAAA
jgi:hypothetical protein